MDLKIDRPDAFPDKTARIETLVQALRDSEERLRLVTDGARLGLVVVDRDRRYRYANNTYAEILGLHTPAIVGQRVADVLPEVYEEQIRPRLDRAFAGERVSYDLPRPAAGGDRHFAVRYEPEEVDGIVGLVVVVISDITESREAEIASRRLAAIVESSDDAIIGKNLDGIVTSWNRGAEKMFGYAAAEMVGTPILRLIPPDRRDEEGGILAKIRRGEGAAHFETIRQAKDGRHIAVAITASPIKDDSGRAVGVSKVVRDLTVRKRAEEVLQGVSARDSGHRRKRIARDLAVIFVLSAVVFAVGRIFDVFDPIFAYFAYKNHQLNSDLNEVVATMAFFGFAMMVFSFRRWREGRAEILSQTQISQALSLMHTEMEAQVRQRTEELTRINESLRQEIAQRERAEATIRQFPAIIESSDDAIISKSLGGIITSWNRAAERMFGYTAAEIIGQPIVRLFPPDRLQEETLILERIGRGERLHHFETVRLRKDGSPLDVSAAISPIKDAAGKITGVSKILRDITERKQAEDQLRWRTAFFEAQVNSALDGIMVVDGGGKTILQNQRMLDLWNFPKDIAFQSDDGLRLKWALAQVRDPRGFAEKVSRLYAHPEEVSRDEVELVDGRVFDRYSAPVLGQDGKHYGRIWLFRDLTERKRSEEKIAEQAAFLDKARDAILVRDLDGRILFWNEGAAKMYGWAGAEAVGQDIAGLLYADRATFAGPNAETIRQGEWQGELQHLARDGRKLTVEARWTLIRDQAGAPKSILAINTDVTEKKKIEAQFLRAQRMESIGTLAGGIAHDLNNILAPIMMSVEILKTTSTHPLATRILETIEVSAKRGADIVRQVLSFARGVEGERVEVQPKHLLRDLASIMEGTFPKDIRMQFSIPNETWTILGDPTQIHQILLNLCVNARDAMPQGGTLTVAVENCVLDEHYAAMNIQARPGRYVHISVTDSGTGIPPDILDKIFEPFFTTKALTKGTGLGLSTVMAIVKSHEGIVNVYSEPGKGTTFKVYLPAAELSAGARPEPSKQDALPRGSGETILVVDDEASILSITGQTLQAYGYRVLTAADGADGLGVYLENKAEIAAVLTDVMMPIMDGTAMIHALMRINPAVKVIAASGLKGNSDVATLSGTGVRHFLAKPYTAGTLLKMIRSILDKPESDRG
jgi:PAS domain S-box-containing protein